MDSVLYKLTDCLPVDFFFFYIGHFYFYISPFCVLNSAFWLTYVSGCWPYVGVFIDNGWTHLWGSLWCSDEWAHCVMIQSGHKAHLSFLLH